MTHPCSMRVLIAEESRGGLAEGGSSGEGRGVEERVTLVPRASAEAAAPIVVPAPRPTPRTEHLPLVPEESSEEASFLSQPESLRGGTLIGPPPRDPMVGTTIGAEYVLRELVGRGSAASVYRAEQAGSGREVAVKILHLQQESDGHDLARFTIEAQAASRLAHPNSVSILDFGLEPGSVPYVVMEFLPGRSLRSLLRENGALGPRTAVQVALAALAALSEAHARGIVHLDLRPENVFVVAGREGGYEVKVADFGLAFLAGEGPLGQPGQAAAAYAAPERWLSEPFDGRTDLYALGAMLCEMLTGRPPFVGDERRQMMAHLAYPPPLPGAVGPCLPASLDEVVRRALEKSPRDRFSCAEEMAAALRGALRDLDTLAADPPRCHACRGPVPRGHRRCARCGAPRFTLSPSRPQPTRRSEPPCGAHGSPLDGLLALEQRVRACERSDLGAAIDACQRGLALARQAHLSTDDDLFEHARISFSFKLGEVLAQAGRMVEAEGVLSEALACGAIDPPQRVRMLVLLGRVAAGRGSRTRAEAYFSEAQRLLGRLADGSLAADVHEAYAAFCRSSGALDEALRAQQAVCEALSRLPEVGHRRASALLSLGSLLVEAGQPRRALGVLRSARDLAEEQRLPSLASTCWQMLSALPFHATQGPAPVSHRRLRASPTDRPRSSYGAMRAAAGSDAPPAR